VSPTTYLGTSCRKHGDEGTRHGASALGDEHAGRNEGPPGRGVALWLARWREPRHLADLDSHMLCDIGLSPADVRIECAKPFWRD
jgi:uncharacterized protein YjiS (DUF1127 family)